MVGETIRSIIIILLFCFIGIYIPINSYIISGLSISFILNLVGGVLLFLTGIFFIEEMISLREEII